MNKNIVLTVKTMHERTVTIRGENNGSGIWIEADGNGKFVTATELREFAYGRRSIPKQ